MTPLPASRHAGSVATPARGIRTRGPGARLNAYLIYDLTGFLMTSGGESESRPTVGRITAASTALILIDLQRCFVDRSSDFAAKGAGELVDRLTALAERCREAGILVILTTHVVRPDHSNAGTLPDKVPAVMEGMIDEDTASAALHPGVHVGAEDVVVRKPRFSAFAGTDLDLILRTRGIDTLIVAGIATDICCESTARDAADRGLHVIFLADGTATGAGPDDPAADQIHEAALVRLDAFFADVVRIGDLPFARSGGSG